MHSPLGIESSPLVEQIDHGNLRSLTDLAAAHKSHMIRGRVGIFLIRLLHLVGRCIAMCLFHLYSHLFGKSDSDSR